MHYTRTISSFTSWISPYPVFSLFWEENFMVGLGNTQVLASFSLVFLPTKHIPKSIPSSFSLLLFFLFFFSILPKIYSSKCTLTFSHWHWTPPKLVSPNPILINSYIQVKVYMYILPKRMYGEHNHISILYIKKDNWAACVWQNDIVKIKT